MPKKQAEIFIYFKMYPNNEAAKRRFILNYNPEEIPDLESLCQSLLLKFQNDYPNFYVMVEIQESEYGRVANKISGIDVIPQIEISILGKN